MELIIENLKKTFDYNEVLKGINFTFQEGKIYGLIGYNEFGKTTFFNCLNKDIDINDGKVYLIDNNLKKEITANDIAYILSPPNVPEFLTGREFLKFFIDINKDRIGNLKTIDEYFDFMKIDLNDRDKLLKDCSYGVKNKIQILINLIAKAKVLLFDEPFNSADIIIIEEMKEILQAIKSNHIVIFSTNIMKVALDLSDEIVMLKNGILTEIKKDDINNNDIINEIIRDIEG